MEYRTHLGDTDTEAHINYECPCGCTAGLIYDRDAGPRHLGKCCCGRLLWVGPQAAAVVRSHLVAGTDYEIDYGAATLPWGEVVSTALAVPLDAVHGAGEEQQMTTTNQPQRVIDPVCGMTIDPRTAAGSSVYAGATYYFCAPGCKERFDSNPKRYVEDRP